jgi:hypothetical protein
LENKTTFVYISASNLGIFLELHTAHFQRMRYNTCKFGYDRSTIKGTLLIEESTFSSASRLPLEGFFLYLHTAHYPRMRYKWYKLGCDRSINKGTLLEEQGTISSVSQLQIEVFSYTFIPRTIHACATNGISWVVIGQ